MRCTTVLALVAAAAAAASGAVTLAPQSGVMRTGFTELAARVQYNGNAKCSNGHVSAHSAVSGGSDCDCEAASTGYVYAWSLASGGPVKIGCVSGDLSACQARVRKELKSGTATMYCYDASSTATHSSESRNGHTYSYTYCDAAEVGAQDHFYCAGKWRGGDGNPDDAQTDGKSEWFDISLATADTKLKALTSKTGTKSTTSK